MLPLLASAAGCSSSSSGGSDNVATDADEAALGDGEVTGLPGGDSPPAASPGVPAGSSAGPSVPLPADADSSAGEEASSADGASAPAPVPPGDDLVPADPIQPQPGTLTAGVWDDNRNLDRFLGYRAELEQLNMPGMLGFSAAEHEAARDAFAQRSARTTLDVALVIDTTGSMGDEISYLQTEFLAISAAIESKYPNAEQRWSLVLYKDEGDEYVTRWFDFRSDAQEFRARLAEQYASGGGDFPEAPDAAFEIMNQLAWRSDPNTARLAFWVADAPHHVDNAEALKVGVEGAEAQDIHVYPVASSGIDELTELTMRSAAQLTGGRYLFLTNDSGVGNSHKEPSIPCYFVTQLDSAILRMVDVEMTGQYREPSAEELVRANGNPEGGTCTLASGQPAFAF
jgi:hypothetical protein